MGERGASPAICDEPVQLRGLKTASARLGRVEFRACEAMEGPVSDVNDRSFVGVDVSKTRLDLAVRPSGKRWSVDNDEAGIKSNLVFGDSVGELRLERERQRDGYERTGHARLL